jgi:hypothetical protein
MVLQLLLRDGHRKSAANRPPVEHRASNGHRHIRIFIPNRNAQELARERMWRLYPPSRLRIIVGCMGSTSILWRST